MFELIIFGQVSQPAHSQGKAFAVVKDWRAFSKGTKHSCASSWQPSILLVWDVRNIGDAWSIEILSFGSVTFLNLCHHHFWSQNKRTSRQHLVVVPPWYVIIGRFVLCCLCSSPKTKKVANQHSNCKNVVRSVIVLALSNKFLAVDMMNEVPIET